MLIIHSLHVYYSNRKTILGPHLVRRSIVTKWSSFVLLTALLKICSQRFHLEGLARCPGQPCMHTELCMHILNKSSMHMGQFCIRGLTCTVCNPKSCDLEQNSSRDSGCLSYRKCFWSKYPDPNLRFGPDLVWT